MAWRRSVSGLRALAEARRLATEVGSTLVVGVAATAATALLARSGPLTPATYEQFDDAVEHWLGTGNQSLLLTCLRNLVPLLSRAGAIGAVLELAASLAAEEHWRTGTGRSAEEAGRAAQQVLRTLAGRERARPSSRSW